MKTSDRLPEECREEIREMIEAEDRRFDDDTDDYRAQGYVAALRRVLGDDDK